MILQTFIFLSFVYDNAAGQAYRIILTKHQNLESMSVSDFQENVDYYKKSLKSYLEGYAKAKFDKNVEYSGIISLGNPQQFFLTYFDTSFSALWLMADDCAWSYYNCYTRKHKYKKNSSVTYTPDSVGNSSSAKITGDKLEISGQYAMDTLWMNSYHQVYDQQLIAVSSFCSDSTLCMLDTSPIPDGVFGLGLPSSGIMMSPPLFTALDRGLISKPLFSMYTNSSIEVGELLIGSENRDVYNENSLFYKTVNNDTNAWKIELDSVQLSGKELCDGVCTVLMDSGSALIAVPREKLKIIHKLLPIDIKTENKVFQVSCSEISSLPILSFYIEKNEYTIPGEGYTVKLKNACVIGFVENEGSLDWVFGQLFMKNFYTIFHFGTKAVGIAKLSGNKY